MELYPRALHCSACTGQPQGLVFPTCLLLSQPHLEQTGLTVSFVGFASVSKYFVPGTLTVGKTPLAGPLHWDSLARIAGAGKRDFEELQQLLRWLKLAPWPAGVSGLLWGV